MTKAEAADPSATHAVEGAANHDHSSHTDVDSVSQPATARGRRKRAAIVAAAREVFEQSGFNEARIADIAKKAGASYGSFYTYFESKEEIFREVVREVMSEMFEFSRPRTGDEDPVVRIEAANRNYVESYARNARMMAVMEELAAYDGFTGTLMMQIRDRFVERNEESVKRLQKAGLADADMDARIAADVLGGMIERFAQVWVGRRPQKEIDAAVPVLTRIWTRGLGVE